VFGLSDVLRVPKCIVVDMDETRADEGHMADNTNEWHEAQTQIL